METIRFLYKFLSSGNLRSVKAKRNIVASFFVQGLSVFVSFLMVRITLDYLNQTNYGIWLTLSSVLLWFSFFDIGLGNGLRNKLAEALSNGDHLLGRKYVSTTYAILSIVLSLVAIVFFVLNRFIDWTLVLNTDKSITHELSILATIVFGFFFINFIVQTISVVLIADQRPTIANLMSPLGNIIALVVIYILTKTTKSSLIYLGITLGVAQLLISLIVSIYYFRNDYRLIAPSFRFVEFNLAGNLLNLGLKFFFIQIASLVVYGSSNLIIGHYFGPSQVTPYNIAYKYFSLLYMLFSIIMLPFWSAFTDAWTKKDFFWIRGTIKNLLWAWVGILLLGCVMLLVSNWFYSIWVGKQIIIPFSLSLGLCVYFISISFGSIFVSFVNGVSKVRLQMYSSFVVAILFVIVVNFMINILNLGMISIVIALLISSMYGVIVTPIQYHKLIRSKATGIWNE